MIRHQVADGLRVRLSRQLRCCLRRTALRFWKSFAEICRLCQTFFVMSIPRSGSKQSNVWKTIRTPHEKYFFLTETRLRIVTTGATRTTAYICIPDRSLFFSDPGRSSQFPVVLVSTKDSPVSASQTKVGALTRGRNKPCLSTRRHTWTRVGVLPP